MLMALDHRRAPGGAPSSRDDLIFFVTHPCHPRCSGAKCTPKRNSTFSGRSRPQNIVCSLVQGPEESYALGEAVARAIYAPGGRIASLHRLANGRA